MNCPLFVKTETGLHELVKFHASGSYVCEILKTVNKSLLTDQWEDSGYFLLVKNEDGSGLYPLPKLLARDEPWKISRLEEVKKYINNPNGFSEHPWNGEEGVGQFDYHTQYLYQWVKHEDPSDSPGLAASMDAVLMMEGVFHTYDKMINNLELIDGEYKYKSLFNEPLINAMVKLLTLSPEAITELNISSPIKGLLKDLKTFLDEI